MPRRKRSKKWISWLIILALLIAAGVVCYFVWDNYFNDKKQDNDIKTETSEQIKEEKKSEEATINEGNEEDGQKVKQYEGENPNKASELSGVITYAGVVDGKVMIRVNIDQYLEEGRCTLNILNGSEVVYENTTNIMGSATTSTCEGFDLSASALSSGAYKVLIKIETNDKNGTIEGSLNI